MTGVLDGLAVVNVMGGGTSYKATGTEAWETAECGFCGAISLLAVARTVGNKAVHSVLWLRCPSCSYGSVVNDGVPSPAPLPHPTPEGVPEAETALWEQVRASLSVGAYTGAAMLCRKLLLHVAYTHQRAENPEAKPLSNFASAVDYLETENVILASHKAWVDQIRKLGNRANHELPHIAAEDAENIARFTHQLFVNLYEMPFKASLDNPLVGEAASPTEEPEDADVSAAE